MAPMTRDIVLPDWLEQALRACGVMDIRRGDAPVSAGNLATKHTRNSLLNGRSKGERGRHIQKVGTMFTRRRFLQLRLDEAWVVEGFAVAYGFFGSSRRLFFCVFLLFSFGMRRSTRIPRQARPPLAF